MYRWTYLLVTLRSSFSPGCRWRRGTARFEIRWTRLYRRQRKCQIRSGRPRLRSLGQGSSRQGRCKNFSGAASFRPSSSLWKWPACCRCLRPLSWHPSQPPCSNRWSRPLPDPPGRSHLFRRRCSMAAWQCSLWRFERRFQRTFCPFGQWPSLLELSVQMSGDQGRFAARKWPWCHRRLLLSRSQWCCCFACLGFS